MLPTVARTVQVLEDEAVLLEGAVLSEDASFSLDSSSVVMGLLLSGRMAGNKRTS